MNSTGRKLSIPQEIIYEIFSWLPVKSLVRFKCVTKFCNSLASESDFLSIHVCRSMTRPGGTEFFSHETRPVFYTTGQIDELYYLAPAYSGLDYVNGLFCFWGPTFAGPAAIFNPSTGEVKEIQKEGYGEPDPVQQKDAKQTAAVDLISRLNNYRSYSDSGSVKVLEEWRKRKMERARQRELEKNGTTI